MNGTMKGKVAIITGAGSGIGRACALAFSKEGIKVVVADVLADQGNETVELIKKSGGEALFAETDVSKAAQVEALVNKTLESYGRLDYGVNNAGIEGAQAPTADCTEENWDRVISINLKGVWLCMKYQIPQILKQGGGAIVNVASIAGLVGFTNIPAYCASKGGILQLTRTAALEYAKNKVRINAVCPGVIKTAMVERFTGGKPEVEAQFAAGEPIGRLGQPEEIASAVLWLCSDGASFVTGHPLVVDGGWVAQ